MIKFFRKIRYDLMETGKTGKYLKYAFGEILLVVIGILIALQVSNWNQERINANTEQVILQDLNTELKSNITALENVINEHQKAHDAAIEVRDLIKDSIRLNTMSSENLDSILQIMNYNWTYNPKLGILNSTTSSGKIDLIQNKEIRYMLSSIQETIIDANESTEEIKNYRGSFYWPLIVAEREMTDYENLIFEAKKMFRDSKFIWWTRLIIAIRKEGLDEEIDLLKFLKNINTQIELELEK